MKLKDLMEKYGEQEVLCSSERTDESIVWLNIGLKPSKPKTVWELKDGDEYYYINADGYVNISTYAEIESEENGVSVGNVFLTKEEALKDVERRKVEALLLKHGGRRWFKDGVANWFIGLAEEEDRLIWFIDNRPVQGVIYFDTEEQARKAIDEIGKGRIIDALFEVR